MNMSHSSLFSGKATMWLRPASFALLLSGFAIVPATAQLIMLAPSNVIGGSPWTDGNGHTYGWNLGPVDGFQASAILNQQQTSIVDPATAPGSVQATWVPAGDINAAGGGSLTNRYAVIDLGAAYVLSQFELFNSSFSQRATGTFSIQASNSITGASVESGYTRGSMLSSPVFLLGSTTLTYTNGQNPIIGQTFAVTDPSAYQYVQITLITATGVDTNQIFSSALTEVRIFGASAIPEPSTYAAIAGIAMLGFAAWRRRRRPTPTATRV